MKLQGIDFGNVFGGAGVQGFFDEGYWFHRFWKPFGLDFTGMTFVAKTATFLPRQGNMPLTRDSYTPKSLFPSCIKIHFLRGVMLNAVGLSNPGLYPLLCKEKWQRRTSPFMISLMSVADSSQQRLEQLHAMIRTLRWRIKDFSAPFGLQLNLSCPNVGHNLPELIDESAKTLKIAGELGVPLMPKYSIASAPIPAIMELNSHPKCDAICVSNTLPFGWQGIDWKRVWGSKKSPLAELGGGGLSGRVLIPLVCDWIKRLREAGFEKPINGGGGILHPGDVKRFRDAGASSVFLGSIASLRPWRVKATIRYANQLTNWR